MTWGPYPLPDPMASMAHRLFLEDAEVHPDVGPETSASKSGLKTMYYDFGH